MMLAVDAGNTRVKWGLHDGAGWHAWGALPNRDAARLRERVAHASIERAIIANVAGDAVARALTDALDGHVGDLIWARSQPRQCGVRNGYDDPAQLGVDRWIALIGARFAHQGPCLVVMAGTATTVDVLDADGLFRGGLILPGIDLMRETLARNTAQLGLAAGVVCELPRNTADAIASGCMQAQLGAVERQFSLIRGDPQALCLIGGGAGHVLYERLPIPRRLVENLVLEGLIRIGKVQA